MGKIRNHGSWVHKSDPDLATEKAKDLLRMAVAKVGLMEPLEEAELLVNPVAMVVGGGISGITAAKNLAEQGYKVHLIERNDKLGGQANNIYQTFQEEDVQAELASLIKTVENSENIQVHINTTIEDVEGFVGSFTSTLSCNGKQEEIKHGMAVVATGASAYKPDEYLFGKDERIITSLDLDRKFINKDASLKELYSAVFIQCVGSREPERPYCSRVCCTHSIDSALELKKINPEMVELPVPELLPPLQ